MSGQNVSKKKVAIQWNSKCQWVFDELKRLCTTAPILAYADFTKPFKLHTDACGSGLGAVLYQTCKDGTDTVISYASRSLNKAESYYPAHKLEFLTLKWVVVRKFDEYLYGSNFDIYTDNNPCTYILTKAKLDAASHQWVASLANYNFQLHYQAGRANIDTDALLRVSCQGACLTTQVHILKSQLQQYKLCKRLLLKVQQFLSRPTFMICTFWTQFGTASRSPV